MLREFLRAKLHNVTVTKADLDYEGSFGVDRDFLDQAGILPFESVEIYNVTNGERLRTYAIALPRGSKRFESNGAAAHAIRKGDRVIVAAYGSLTADQITSFEGPRILIFDSENRVKDSFIGQSDI